MAVKTKRTPLQQVPKPDAVTAGRVCSECKHWLSMEDRYIGLGECHRAAPGTVYEATLLNGQDNFLAPLERIVSWPVTGNIDWCGEFSPKPTTQHAA